MKTIMIDVPRECDYGRQIHRGIYRYARPNCLWLFDDVLSRDGRKWLRDTNTVGLVSSQSPQSYMTIARRFGLKAVGVGSWFPSAEFKGLPYVNVDPEAVGEMAADYFIGRGFRHFAMIDCEEIGYSKVFLSRYRGKAFAAALQNRDLACDVFDPKKRYSPCGDPLPAIIGIDERIRRWLAGLSKPLAVMTPNDYLGQWICGVCWGAGFRVPEEIAVLGVNDDAVYCARAYPPLSSIAVPAEQVGYEAAKTMDIMLRRKNASRRPVLLPPIGVITRQSTDIMAIEDQWVVEAVSFIRRNAHKGLRVDEVANEVHLPRRTLERRFRKALGRGLFAEIRRVQIEHVKMMLAQTTETLETLSPQCGFKDVTRMSKVFRKAIGTSPGAYRRQFYGLKNRD